MKNDTDTYIQAARLGVVAGMRSMAAVNVLSDYLNKVDPSEIENTPLVLLKSPAANTALRMAMAGEMLADKLPFIAARISPPPLLWRVLWGAVLGAALSMDKRRVNPLPAALVGGTAALLATYAVYHLRKQAGEHLHIPDLLLGAAEDAAVIALSTDITRRLT